MRKSNPAYYTPVSSSPSDPPSIPQAIISSSDIWKMWRNTSCAWYSTLKYTIRLNRCLADNIPLCQTADRTALSVPDQTSQPSCFLSLTSNSKWFTCFWASHKLDPPAEKSEVQSPSQKLIIPSGVSVAIENPSEEASPTMYLKPCEEFQRQREEAMLVHD